jgi:arsenate reductase
MPSRKAVDLYGIVNCDQVKKARAWFATEQLDVRFHDFKTEPPTAALVNGWLSHLPWDQLINRRGTTWRLLDESKRPTDAASALAAVLAQPTLIKRPIVSSGAMLLVGFDAARFAKAFRDDHA